MDTRAPESSSRGHWRPVRTKLLSRQRLRPWPVGFFVSFHRLGVCASRPSVRSADSQFHNKCPRSPSSRASAQHYPEQPLLFPLALHCSCQDPAYRLITAAINRPARHASHTHTHTHTRGQTHTHTHTHMLVSPSARCPMPTPTPPANQAIGTRFVPSRA